MTRSAEPGTIVAHVRVEIDYAILEHFSKHLYSSPNKAVEELVTNGYDALAKEVRVYLPGEHGKDCLLVWDDGDSMDIEGIRRLWWIARSPKDDGTTRVAKSPSGEERKMIGKFGIGKLASYAVGQRMSHLCHRDGKYFLVAVDYNLAPRIDETNEPKEVSSFEVPVQELTEEEALNYAKTVFRKVTHGFTSVWKRSNWTLAIVDQIKDDVTLTPGRLSWVLGNGMPSRPDFTVYVNDVKVTPKIEKNPKVTWNASEKVVKNQIKSEWESARKSGIVQGDLTFSPSRAKEPFIVLPNLGEVRFEMKLYDRSLFQKDRADAGRSEGFFILVRDRLLNPDDAKFFLHDPSYGAFNRMQIFIWADGLDAELLADRERLHRSTPHGAELALLQAALYKAARNKLTAVESQARTDSTVSELPLTSREMVRAPLTALMMNEPDADLTKLDLRKTRVAVENSGKDEPLVRLDVEENRIVSNLDHPLYSTMIETFGNNKNGREAQKLVEMYGIADLLLKGQLLDLGISSEIVDKVMLWRETLLRSLGTTFKQDPDLIVKEVYDTSYKGGKSFENALAKLFRLLGFITNMDGASGKKDILAVAPVGETEFTFTVEAKGSKNAVENDKAEISGASAHAAEVGASFSIVVARQFTGFARQKDDTEPAVLNECRTQAPPVSVVTVDALVALYRSVYEHHYPLALIAGALQEIESPNDKEKRVQQMLNPLSSDISWRAVLDTLWELQQGTASKEPVSTLQLRQSKPEWKSMSREKFNLVLLGLESFTGGLIKLDSSQNFVNLHQAPEIVAERVSAALAGK